MALTSFADVQAFFNNFIKQNNIQIGQAPHGAFWNTSYSNFVNGNVPNVTDPNNNPIPILVSGFSGQSNIIFALAGTPNTWWDPKANVFGQMPYGGPYSPPLRFRNSPTGLTQTVRSRRTAGVAGVAARPDCRGHASRAAEAL